MIKIVYYAQIAIITLTHPVLPMTLHMVSLSGWWITIVKSSIRFVQISITRKRFLSYVPQSLNHIFRFDTMYNSKTKWIFAMSVTAIAIGALAFVGSGLSTGIAQMGYNNSENSANSNLSNNNSANSDLSNNNSAKSWSGTVNSIVENANGKYIVGGEWTLSLDGNNVTELNADIDMVSSDGMGPHTHRILINNEATQIASTANVQVILVPTEQSAGKAVLVNVTGLAASTNVTVKVDDNITGLTESDEDGNLLYALGTTESMQGSLTVSVEDGEGNRGSAPLTVTESQDSTTNNATRSASATSSANNNIIGTNTSNITTSANGTLSSESGDNEAASTGQLQNNTAGTDSSTNQTGYSIQTQIQSPSNGSENTTLSTPSIINDTSTITTMAGNNTIASASNATDTTNNENVTSFNAESSVVAEISANTTTFKTKADIYSNGEPKWEDVDITVSLTNGRVLTIGIDPQTTDDHFGQEPIYGIVTLSGDFYR